MKLLLQKKAKFLSAGGTTPTPPCLRRLGALPPSPQPPVAWGIRPHTLISLRRLPTKQPSRCEFLAMRLAADRFFKSLWAADEEQRNAAVLLPALLLCPY